MNFCSVFSEIWGVTLELSLENMYVVYIGVHSYTWESYLQLWQYLVNTMDQMGYYKK